MFVVIKNCHTFAVITITMIIKFFSFLLLIFSLLTCDDSSNDKSELDKQLDLTIDLLRTMRELEKASNDMKSLEINTLDSISAMDIKYVEYCDSVIAAKKDSKVVTKDESITKKRQAKFVSDGNFLK
jgi:hypothetical protein